MKRCYCSENTKCDFCYGHRHPEIPELNSPVRMVWASRILSSTPELVAKMSVAQATKNPELRDYLEVLRNERK